MGTVASPREHSGAPLAGVHQPYYSVDEEPVKGGPSRPPRAAIFPVDRRRGS